MAKPKKNKPKYLPEVCQHCKMELELPGEFGPFCPDCGAALCQPCYAEAQAAAAADTANIKKMISSLAPSPPTDGVSVSPLTPSERIDLIALHLLLREYRDERRARRNTAEGMPNAGALLPDLLTLALDVLYVPVGQVKGNPAMTWRAAPIRWWLELCDRDDCAVQDFIAYVKEVRTHVANAAICADPLTTSANW